MYIHSAEKGVKAQGILTPPLLSRLDVEQGGASKGAATPSAQDGQSELPGARQQLCGLTSFGRKDETPMWLTRWLSHKLKEDTSARRQGASL